MYDYPCGVLEALFSTRVVQPTSHLGPPPTHTHILCELSSLAS